MRTDRELLELLYIHTVKEMSFRKRLFNISSGGLCDVVYKMYKYNYIFEKESDRLYLLIRNKGNHPQYMDSAFYFKPYRLRPRLKYIKQLISNL